MCKIRKTTPLAHPYVSNTPNYKNSEQLCPRLQATTVCPTASNSGLSLAIACVAVMDSSIVTSSKIKSTSGAGLLLLAVQCIMYLPASKYVDMLEFTVTGELSPLWPSHCMDKSTVSTGNFYERRPIVKRTSTINKI